MGTAGNPAPLHSRSRCLWKKSTMLGCSKTPCSIARRMQDAWWDAVMTPECSWFSRSDRSLFFSWLRQCFIKIGWSPYYTYFNILHPSPSGHTISHLTIFSTIKKKGLFSSNEQRGRKVLEKPNTRKDKGRLQVNWQTNRSLLLFPTAR